MLLVINRDWEKSCVQPDSSTRLEFEAQWCQTRWSSHMCCIVRHTCQIVYKTCSNNKDFLPPRYFFNL